MLQNDKTVIIILVASAKKWSERSRKKLLCFKFETEQRKFRELHQGLNQDGKRRVRKKEREKERKKVRKKESKKERKKERKKVRKKERE